MAQRIGTEYNPFCIIDGEPKIGKNCWIGPFTVLDASGGLTIGDGVEVSYGVKILSHSTDKRCIGERRIIDGEVNKDDIEYAPTQIGDYTFIGTNAVILKGVTIGHHCVIGAGAVVTRDIPPNTTVMGVPARPINN